MTENIWIFLEYDDGVPTQDVRGVFSSLEKAQEFAEKYISKYSDPVSRGDWTVADGDCYIEQREYSHTWKICKTRPRGEINDSK